mmetsp:Transcript_169/g.579  ORF Transcript_169/g.579 Transcript_169/m.579 type:complete len:89 (+) Transcript_169:73-339(+)|eukprot:CAMPEP_0114610428 /NCGR_PEP_ID=MMETSP0168-20121206/3596_1 /TAXON_ID=95228 ORGANISM="Vannella sp., Strain DIVA3 517/6/12" /NCGR_SAMPLE_ID=MMETSP0168 /ASSEMBLY_ACC=CAM_ASM_000044 /LENGTH=88 /DNA_ID=CAMNT_0001821371 /DNA_START=53 /DNA_END=319 /DNA_ORIENTATION=-
MGILTGLLTDAFVVTTAFGGVRRFTGFNIAGFLSPHIKNDGLRAFTAGYFKIGDFVVNRTCDFFSKQGKALAEQDRKDKEEKRREQDR